MPLLPNLPYTDLTKLKFGDPRFGDRPGGGWSGQPFISTSGLDVSRIPIEDLGRTGGPDMFLRGGYLTPGRIKEDEQRLLKLFTKTDRGVLFSAQQNLLSTIGVRIYGGYPTKVGAANSFRLNDGTYNPLWLSTLLGAAGNAFGAHPNKQGTDPTGQSEILSRPQYLNLVKGGIVNTGGLEGIANINNNRLVNLFNTKINQFGIGGSFLGIRNIDNPENLYSYAGGPQADEGGLGRTYIKVGGDSPTRQNGGQILRGYGGEGAVVYATFSQNMLATKQPIANKTISNVTDFRKDIVRSKDIPNTVKRNLIRNGSLTASPNYTTKNIEQRVYLGDPGKRGVDRSNYTTGRPDNKKGLDQINALYLYKRGGVTGDDRKNDLVKFRIAVIDNDNPNLKTFAHFRAFVKSFTDNVNASWKDFNYIGRGEKFFNYTGFTRSVSMGFTVVAQSVQELSIMYQKLNYLMSHMSPNYSNSGYMRGNLVQLTLGGYLYEVPGVITNLTYTIPDDTTWEIGIPATKQQQTNPPNGNAFSDSAVKELPHRIEVSITFRPIEKFLPQIVGSSFDTNNKNGILGAESIKQRFISLEDAGGDINTLYANGIAPQFRVGDHEDAAIKKQVLEGYKPTDTSDFIDLNDPGDFEGTDSLEDYLNEGGFANEQSVPLIPNNP